MSERRAGLEGVDRRAFLRMGAAFAATAGAPFAALAGSRFHHVGPLPSYGPLAPVADESTGRTLLRLPPGFRYLSMSWTGDPMLDGAPTPGFHDGGGALWGGYGRISYVRNHEQQFPFASTVGSFAPRERTYDAGFAPGGTTTVLFDSRRGRHRGTFPSLSGTVRNCAGGPTPWHSWITCEETLLGPDGFLRESHGWAFEVHARRRPDPRPLTAMGRFVREAVAVDPWTGWVYQTEDRQASGLYRFVPERYGRLRDGGMLEMLRFRGQPFFDTGPGVADGSSFLVDWVPIADPTKDVFLQGLQQGGAIFRRGEGIFHRRGRVVFCATSGGAAGSGQVWQLDPHRDELTLLFESPGPAVLNRPDNIAISRRGGILLCEDGVGRPMYLRGLTRQGEIYDFAANNIVLAESPNGVIAPGDYRGREFAGASFSPDGRWLFVSVQTPGVTFAITGPWRKGPL